MEKNTKHEEGQSMILIAFLAVAIISFMGLLLDGGRVYAARRQSQNAADAAAFAAARKLVGRNGDNGAAMDATILQVAKNFAGQNGITNPDTDIVAYYMVGNSQGNTIGLNGYVQSGATGVRVQATSHTQPFMISVLTGGSTVNTMSQATMQSGVMTQFNGAEPMTVKFGSFTFNQTVGLMGDVTGPGGFQWLATAANNDCQGGGSAGDLADAILNPQDGTSKTADPSGNFLNAADDSNNNNLIHYFCGSTGVSGGDAVASALGSWFDKPIEQRYWIIPLYDYICKNSDSYCPTGSAGGANQVYHIVSFAKFIPTGYYLSNSHSLDMTKEDCEAIKPGVSNPQCVIGTFQGFTSLGHGDSGQACTTQSGCALWLSE